MCDVTVAIPNGSLDARATKRGETGMESRSLRQSGHAGTRRTLIRKRRGDGGPGRNAGLTNAAMALAGILLVLSCGDGAVEPAPAEPARPATITVEPSSTTLTWLGETVVFRATVKDQYGAAFPGTVTWSSSDEAVFTIDAGGTATAVANGSGTVTAIFQSLSATAAVHVEQAPASLETVSGSGQTADLGAVLAESVVVLAADAGGSPVEGATVMFTPGEGHGTVDPAEAVTDSAGLARTMWTLGEVAGDQTLHATVGDAVLAVVAHPINPDRAALVALYNATDGPNWVNNDNWLTDAPLGEWFGVETDTSGRVVQLVLAENGVTGVIPPELGQLGKIQVLDLWENSLYGHIPPELGSLGELQSLRLAGNLLAGTIPPTLGELTKLEVLWLRRNLLAGSIPTELANLTELTSLRLDQNELEGQIPSQLADLTNLITLNLGWNNLTGPIPPQLGDLARLSSLSLNGNELTGPIPPELGNLTGLGSLLLSNNDLTGAIPPWLSDFTRLRTLLLHNNELTGPIPPQLGGLSELQLLSLAGNQLSGPIPPELGNLEQLDRLELARNQLSGPIPPELGNLRRLVTLTLSENLLTGSLPQTFLGLTSLVTMGCRGTRGACMPATDAFREWARQVEARGSVEFPVNIPWCDEIDREALEALYEAANGSAWTRSDGWLDDEDLGEWYGVRTDSVGRVSELDLSGNGLSGYLPDALAQLVNLRELRIRDNALAGRLPLALTGLPLEEFDYGGTSLCVADDAGFRGWLSGIPRHSGTGAQCPPLTEHEVLEWLYRNTDGPRWYESAGWLTDAPLAAWHGVETNAAGRVVGLTLQFNGLSGPLPVELEQLSELRSLSLKGNRLSGTIPPELGELGRLELLDLELNRLSGSIPSELGQLSELRSLSLFRNRLSGAIPPELGELGRLELLNLARNRLSGELPRELGKLASLKELDFLGNFLSGAVPAELGDLNRLERLTLAGNRLSGGVPPELGELGAIESIQLSYNRLTGRIPPSLGALGRLSELDLSENQLTGPIPAELRSLSNLRRLRFIGNDLSGAIPPELGALARLSRLDLADNQLSGPIPATLGDLPNLDALNLGDNDLSGPIPAKLGRAARLENLDLQSNALAGPVPSEFSNLVLLKSLILADNPDLSGPLPAGVTALGQLERFMAGGTGLCLPAGSRFDAWFGGIADRLLARCPGGPAVYLTQTVQSWDYPVPLLAGEPALLRVFVTAAQDVAATMPAVKATFHVNGAERHTVRIAAGTQPIPHEVKEGDLALSANAEIPASVITPVLEMVVEVDPDATLDPALGVTRRIPEEGRMAVAVQAMAPLPLTLVPFLHESEGDSSIAASVLAMAEDPDGHELLADVRRLLPVTELAVAAHQPVTTSSHDSGRLLLQTQAMRLMEGGSGYWMGVIQPPPRTGGANWYYLLPHGLADVGGWTSVSIREPSTMAHELGHNLGLRHAPCGNPLRIDPWFPHPAGNTGAWGYDIAEKSLVAPSTPDLMSYCVNRGYWISDFSFNKALNHRRASDGSAAIAMTTEADPVRSLLVWGGRDRNGVPYLDPAFVVDAAPSIPATGGDHTIEGAASDGTPIFSFTFDMPAMADAEGEETSFVFTLPVQPDWEDDLASITLSGPGGSTTLDENTDQPMAILRDPRTGQVRAFLRDLPPATQTAADAIGRTAGQGLETLLSRGIPPADAWRR